MSLTHFQPMFLFHFWNYSADSLPGLRGARDGQGRSQYKINPPVSSILEFMPNDSELGYHQLLHNRLGQEKQPIGVTGTLDLGTSDNLGQKAKACIMK